ncbi:MAG: alpha-galactosidase [Candidatus Helarchaeota archaeon]
MNEITCQEQNSIVSFSNDFFTLKFDLNQGFYEISESKTGMKVFQNAFSLVVLKKHQNDKDIWMNHYSTDEYKKSWNLEETMGKNGESGKSLVINLAGDDKKPIITITFTLYEKKSPIVIQVKVKNTLDVDLRLVELHPLHVVTEKKGVVDLGEGMEEWRVFKTDWQSWSKAKVLGIFDKDTMTKTEIARKILYSNPKEKRKKGLIVGEIFTAIHDRTSRSTLICGFVTLKDQFCQVLLKANKKKKALEFFTARSQADEILFEPGDEVSSEKLAIFLDLDGNPLQALNEYFEMVATWNDARTWPTIPKGWCSWYHYFQNISEKETLKNLEFIAENSNDIQIDFFQLDDGYQIRAGEWDANPKFPSGMAKLVQSIKEKGYMAGLWTAPFFISSKSRLAKEHPEWFFKKENGRPIVASLEGFENSKYRFLQALTSKSLALDCTHPEVQQFLRDLFGKIREWGFQYYKIDFLYAGALQTPRHIAKMTRAQAYRKGLEIIRETVGDDAFILGCGAPLGPAIGIVNGMRVSTDTAPAWNPLLRKVGVALLGLENLPSVVSAMHNNILLSFLHAKLWINDPDCLMIRDHDTALSENEVRTQLTIIGLTNGMYMLSDDFSHVSSERIKLIKVFQPLDRSIDSALPIDLFEFNTDFSPFIYGTKIRTEQEEWWLVAIINWKDTTLNKTLQFNFLGLDSDREYHVFEFWTRQYFGIQKEFMEFEDIPKHACLLLCIREIQSAPQLISSSFHFTQGAEIKKIVREESQKKLLVELEMKGSQEGSLYFFDPTGSLPKNVKTDAINHVVEPIQKNIFRIDLVFVDKCKLELYF